MMLACQSKLGTDSNWSSRFVSDDCSVTCLVEIVVAFHLMKSKTYAGEPGAKNGIIF